MLIQDRQRIYDTTLFCRMHAPAEFFAARLLLNTLCRAFYGF